MISLCKRATRTYVGTWQHLDKWSWVANANEIARKQVFVPRAEDDDDPCEPVLEEVYLLVEPDSPALYEAWSDAEIVSGCFEEWAEAEIKTAIRDTYTQAGCSHEYDCCGCRSYHAGEPKRVTGDLWRVEISSYRNY